MEHVEGHVIRALDAHLNESVSEAKEHLKEAEGPDEKERREIWSDGYICAAETSLRLARMVVHSIAFGVDPFDLDLEALSRKARNITFTS